MGHSKAAQRIHGLALNAAAEVIKRELGKQVSAVCAADFPDLSWYLTDYDHEADFEATLYVRDHQDLATFGQLTIRYGDGSFTQRFGEFEATIRLGDFAVRLRTTCTKYSFEPTEAERAVRATPKGKRSAFASLPTATDSSTSCLRKEATRS